MPHALAPTAPLRTQGRGASRLLGALMVGIAVAYGAALLSPLRVNTDVMVYLLESASAPFEQTVEGDQYPPGYPLLLRLFAAVPLPFPATVALSNLVGLGLGCWALLLVFRRWLSIPAAVAWLALLVVLSNYALIKHVSLAMPDVLSAALSWGLLAVLWGAVRDPASSRSFRARLGLVALAVGLAVVGIALRTANVVLVVPIVAACGVLLGRQHVTRRQYLGAAVLVIALCLLAGAIAIRSGSVTTYVTALGESIDEFGIDGNAYWNTKAKLRNSGELLFNLPSARTFPVHPHVARLYRWSAPLVVLVLSLGFWSLRKRALPVHAFSLGALAFLALWPSIDLRMWLPVLPFLVVYAAYGLWRIARAAGLRRPSPLASGLVVLLVGYYVLTGALALGYSAWLSTSGPAFPARYGGGSHERAYETACRADLDAAAYLAAVRDPAGDDALPGVEPAADHARPALALLLFQEPLAPPLSPCRDDR